MKLSPRHAAVVTVRTTWSILRLNFFRQLAPSHGRTQLGALDFLISRQDNHRALDRLTVEFFRLVIAIM